MIGAAVTTRRSDQHGVHGSVRQELQLDLLDPVLDKQIDDAFDWSEQNPYLATQIIVDYYRGDDAQACKAHRR